MVISFLAIVVGGFWTAWVFQVLIIVIFYMPMILILTNNRMNQNVELLLILQGLQHMLMVIIEY